MKIEFTASLQGASCIRIDDDHAAHIKLTCDAGQIAQVVKLLSLQGKAFKVSVEAER